MNIAETLSSLLPGVEISEEFVNKLQATIETAVAQRVDEQVNQVKLDAKTEIDELTEKANAYAEYVVETMTQKVDDYCEFVIEQFVEENKKNLVETEEYNRMAFALRTIREAFETNYFQLNDEPANKDLERRLEESKASYNTLFNQHVDLKHQIDEYSKYIESENRKNIFEAATKDLADTQKETVKKIVENSRFSNLETFEAGVNMLVEEFRPVVTAPINQTASETIEVIDQAPAAVVAPVEDKMSKYLSRL